MILLVRRMWWLHFFRRTVGWRVDVQSHNARQTHGFEPHTDHKKNVVGEGGNENIMMKTNLVAKTWSPALGFC